MSLSTEIVLFCSILFYLKLNLYSFKVTLYVGKEWSLHKLLPGQQVWAKIIAVPEVKTQCASKKFPSIVFSSLISKFRAYHPKYVSSFWMICLFSNGCTLDVSSSGIDSVFYQTLDLEKVWWEIFICNNKKKNLFCCY